MTNQKKSVKKVRTQEDIDNLELGDLVQIVCYGVMLYNGHLLTESGRNRNPDNCVFLDRNSRNPDQIIEYHIRRDKLSPEGFPHEGLLSVSETSDYHPEIHIFQKFDYKYRDEALKRAGL